MASDPILRRGPRRRLHCLGPKERPHCKLPFVRKVAVQWQSIFGQKPIYLPLGHGLIVGLGVPWVVKGHLKAAVALLHVFHCSVMFMEEEKAFYGLQTEARRGSTGMCDFMPLICCTRAGALCFCLLNFLPFSQLMHFSLFLKAKMHFHLDKYWNHPFDGSECIPSPCIIHLYIGR